MPYQAFVTVSHFNPSLIFDGKARSLPLKCRPVTVSNRVGFSFESKKQSRVGVTDIDKHSSLVW
jgi:hypothetical protein